MASYSRALTRFGAAATRLSATEAVRPYANFATATTTTSYATRPVLPSSAAISGAAGAVSVSVPRQFARTYAAAAPAATPTPKKKPGKIRTTFKWLWRATYLSVIVGVGAVIYDGYLDRNPDDQFTPSSDKKTLVILGTGWGSVSLLKKLDTANYNVVVISPRNYFLFTPLLPSCTTGNIEHRSIMEPVRQILRHKKAAVKFYEAEATKIDYEKKVIKISDNSDIKGTINETEVPYDMLVIGVGAENATFGIPGVREHSCFLKEIRDAQAIRTKIMDCVETAAFKDQDSSEIDRLLHMVVVGGGPTGVEFAGELRDFFDDDIKKLIPDISPRFKVTLIEALPTVLPMFSKQLIDYTESTFKEEHIEIKTKTMVKKVTDKTVEAQVTNPDGSKSIITIPYGLLESRRGLAVNEYLVVQGARDIWAVGDCAVAGYAPTAQVAAQEGGFLARLFNNMAKTEELESRVKELSSNLNLKPGNTAEITAEIEGLEKQLRRVKDVKPFNYSHQGSLAYIGSEKAVADIAWLNGNVASGGKLTYLFWRSAYLSMCFSTRNRVLVALDWVKAKLYGRDVSRE
ncbi:hypothetical protein E0Z10_g5868 [Xylaria hypoxylon]|uniref:NADH:ubiquinone reductase (non-electrogenic) n=1 Tax=Xylaria hypoxylon TaxID=37992 RepID=A0A4Z0YUW2_9PEZI|nr:hypothetical protein E0Z10_g5868 [Xylaria hypoxylon]